MKYFYYIFLNLGSSLAVGLNPRLGNAWQGSTADVVLARCTCG